ncbi:MAG TPA: DMT family transporter [Pararhizobium sp.]|nr:DMT family transporter [Pararhizobium sp.]
MQLRAYCLLIITTLFWGANAIAGKLAVGHVSPFLLTSMRWGLAFLAAVALAAPQLRRDWPIMKKHLLLLFMLGAVGFALFNDAFYLAANYTTAINIVIMQAGMPLIIFIANFFLFRTRATGGQAIGFVLTLAGVLVVASNGSLDALLHLKLNRGDALMLLAILCYGGYTVALRWKPQIHWLSLMTALSAAAFVTSLPFTGWEIATGGVIWPDLPGIAIGVFTALLPGLIAQITYIRGNEMIGSNRAGLFINLVPIFGTLMSIAILGETLRPFHVVALALVLSGIALAERSKGAPRGKARPSEPD